MKKQPPAQSRDDLDELIDQNLIACPLNPRHRFTEKTMAALRQPAQCPEEKIDSLLAAMPLMPHPRFAEETLQRTNSQSTRALPAHRLLPLLSRVAAAAVILATLLSLENQVRAPLPVHHSTPVANSAHDSTAPASPPEYPTEILLLAENIAPAGALLDPDALETLAAFIP